MGEGGGWVCMSECICVCVCVCVCESQIVDRKNPYSTQWIVFFRACPNWGCQSLLHTHFAGLHNLKGQRSLTNTRLACYTPSLRSWAHGQPRVLFVSYPFRLQMPAGKLRVQLKLCTPQLGERTEENAPLCAVRLYYVAVFNVAIVLSFLQEGFFFINFYLSYRPKCTKCTLWFNNLESSSLHFSCGISSNILALKAATKRERPQRLFLLNSHDSRHLLSLLTYVNHIWQGVSPQTLRTLDQGTELGHIWLC